MQNLRFLMIFLLSFHALAEESALQVLDRTEAQCLTQTKVSQKIRGDLQRKYDEIQETLNYLTKVELTNYAAVAAAPAVVVFMSVRGYRSIQKMIQKMEPTLTAQQKQLLKENKLFKVLDSLPAEKKIFA